MSTQAYQQMTGAQLPAMEDPISRRAEALAARLEAGAVEAGRISHDPLRCGMADPTPP